MATLLLLMIYVVFIGLGIPDSVVGAAWPGIYPDLNVPVGYASFITIITSLFTTVASFFSARLVNKFGTGVIAAVSTFLTAVALIGYSFASSIWVLILCAIPAGFGAGAIDAALNNYVAVHYKSSHLNFLHCFYGIGVALSPLLLSFALDNNDWRFGFRTVFYIQLGLTALAVIILPLWKKVKTTESKEKDFTPVTLPYKKMCKMAPVRAGWVVYFTTCALEFTCDHWCCTYLVSAEGATEAQAARFLMIYYIGMALGRFISGLISSKVSEKPILACGYTLIGAAIITLFLPVPLVVKAVALFLIGFGNGPTYPNLTLVTPKTFGKEISQSLVSSQAVAANLGILIIPSVFGVLAQNLSLKIFPPFMAIIFAVMVIYTFIYFARIKRYNKNNKGNAAL